MSQDKTASGVNFMSMGAFLYKAMSKMSKYQLELMKLANDQAINYAKSYAGFDEDGKFNIKDSLVGAFLGAASKAAENAGDAIRMDAKNALVSAAIGAVAVGLTAGAWVVTTNGAIDKQIEDAQVMKNQSGEADIALKEKADGVDGIEASEKEKFEKLKNDWAEVGGSKIDEFQKKVPEGASDELKEKIEEENAFNKKALKHARADEATRAKIDKNIEKRLKQLNEEKGQLAQKFHQILTFIQYTTPSLTSALQVQYTNEKAEHQSKSQMEAAVQQVLATVQQQMESAITKAQADADKYGEAAGSAAAGYGQMTQTRG